MDLEKKIENYLKESFGPAAELAEMRPAGKGTHGTAYRLKVITPEEEKRLIFKTLSPSGFGHDHFSDRARVLLLANANYNRMPKHVRAFDVVGDSPHRFVSLKEAREFYIFMEEAKGASYFSDLNIILERGSRLSGDESRAQTLAVFLARIHAKRYDEKNARTLYRRRIRDLVGHGECIMGIIDAYNGDEFTTERELVEYAEKSLSWWGRIRDRHERLCEVHGDFHPGNIWFDGDEFALLDRARGTWGEAADDLSCLSVNYLHYALKDTGSFGGPFAELFRQFIRKYLKSTGDEEILEVIQPFFAFRILVLANPRFYPHETNETRRKLMDFGHSVLETERFDINKIAEYLNRRSNRTGRG
jgi:serine/threonine protein kinase